MKNEHASYYNQLWDIWLNILCLPGPRTYPVELSRAQQRYAQTIVSLTDLRPIPIDTLAYIVSQNKAEIVRAINSKCYSILLAPPCLVYYYYLNNGEMGFLKENCKLDIGYMIYLNRLFGYGSEVDDKEMYHKSENNANLLDGIESDIPYTPDYTSEGFVPPPPKKVKELPYMPIQDNKVIKGKTIKRGRLLSIFVIAVLLILTFITDSTTQLAFGFLSGACIFTLISTMIHDELDPILNKIFDWLDKPLFKNKSK